MATISASTLILFLVVAAVCGAIGRALAGDLRGGLLTSTALGSIGALAGTWIIPPAQVGRALVLNVAGHQFPIVWTIVGSALCVAILHLLSRPRTRLRV